MCLRNVICNCDIWLMWSAHISFHYRWPTKIHLAQVYSIHIVNAHLFMSVNIVGQQMYQCMYVCVSISFDSRYFHSKNNNKDVVISSINFWSGFNNFICSLSPERNISLFFSSFVPRTLVCWCSVRSRGMRNMAGLCTPFFIAEWTEWSSKHKLFVAI